MYLKNLEILGKKAWWVKFVYREDKIQKKGQWTSLKPLSNPGSSSFDILLTNLHYLDEAAAPRMRQEETSSEGTGNSQIS